MKIKILQLGKTSISYLKSGISDYEQRLLRYIKVESICIPEPRNIGKLPIEQQKQVGSNILLDEISKLKVKGGANEFVLLDERGNELNSIAFSEFLRKKTIKGLKNLVFIIGGAYGFSDAIYNSVSKKNIISLSKMTFSHQMVRLIFYEQVYRAFTILRGEPYHHE